MTVCPYIAIYSTDTFQNNHRDAGVIFKTLATLAETFVFLYMGVGLFLESGDFSKTVPFACVALVGCVVGRGLNIFPMTKAVNRWRGRKNPIPVNHQNALFVSGLRGAVAFALASASVSDLGSEVGTTLRTATLMIVIFTVLFIGGATHSLVDAFKLKEASAWYAIDEEEVDGRLDREWGGSEGGGDGYRGTLSESGARDAPAPEFRVENFESGMNRLGGHLTDSRGDGDLNVRRLLFFPIPKLFAHTRLTLFFYNHSCQTSGEPRHKR
jgi:hypothetical protein